MMKLLKKLMKRYLTKWELHPVELIWVMAIFAIAGMTTVYLRGILTPLLWGDVRNWGYYVTMPIVFVGIYYVVLMSCAILAGYQRVFFPMLRRPLVCFQWLRRLWLRLRRHKDAKL